MLIGLLADNLARLGQLLDEPCGQLLFLVRLVALLLGVEDSGLKFCLSGQRDVLLVGTVEHTHLVAVADEFAGCTVDVVQRHLAAKLLGELQLDILRDEGLSRQEVAHALVDKITVAVVVTLLVVALGSSELQALGPVKLGLREAMLAHTLRLGHGSSQSAQNVVRLAAYRHGESLLGTAYEEVAGASRGTHVRRVGLLAQFAETYTQHRTNQTVHVVAAQVLLVVLPLVGRGVTLHVQVNHDGRLLLVLLYGDNHPLIVGNGIVDALGRMLRHGNLREKRLHLLLNLVDVDVAYYNDGLQVGAIPLLVVVAQVLIGKVVDNLHRADGQAVLILGTLVDGGHGVLHQPLHGHAGTAIAPLLVYHATLLVYLLVFEQDVVAPVVEHEQT